MDDNTITPQYYLCPACFAREVDYAMHYDEADGEYYCTRCSYAGTLGEVKAFYHSFTRAKYKQEFRCSKADSIGGAKA